MGRFLEGGAMKIGIFSEPLNDRQAVGIGTYAYNLIDSLIKLAGDNRYYLINYQRTKVFNDIDKIVIKNPFRRISKTYAWYPYAVINLRKVNYLDIVHNPSHAPTFFRTRQKNVITVHDITPYIFPSLHNMGRPLIHKLLFPRTLRNAAKIIADSNSTRGDLVKHMNIPQEKITVIYLGVDHERCRPLPEREVQYIREVYGFDSPFILYVGTLEPRKNIPTLIKAFHKLKKAGIEHKLVIAGKRGWKYKEIFEMIENLNLRDDVIFTGYVLEEDLPALYNAAALFAYPSLYEGFGLPVLEAMACGTPVITSNVSSLPEIAGDAGIVVDPYDVEGLATAMYELLTNDSLRQDMVEKGLKRAAMFSWEKTARETLEVYEGLA